MSPLEKPHCVCIFLFGFLFQLDQLVPGRNCASGACDRTEAPEIDDGSESWVKGTIGFTMHPFCVFQEFEKWRLKPLRLRGEGRVELIKGGVGPPMRKDFFRLLEFCDDLTFQIILGDCLMRQNGNRPSRAKSFPLEIYEMQFGLFGQISATQ